jgi:hypothetical protein
MKPLCNRRRLQERSSKEGTEEKKRINYRRNRDGVERKQRQCREVTETESV